MGDQVVGGEAKKLPQYVAALSVCMGAVAAGTVLGWTSNISAGLEAGDLNDVTADTDQQGWIGSWVTLGAMIMCFPIGLLCDLLGRKLAMLLTILPFTAGWLLIIFCNSITMIYAGRFLTGLAGGAFCVSAPMYTSEIAQDEIRGTLGAFFQLLLVTGILISYLLGAFIDIKVYSIVCALFPLIFGVLFFLQPETPIYLMKKGKVEEARKALQKLRGAAYNCGPELEKIKANLAEDERMKMPFLKSLRKRSSKLAILLCFGLMFFQQMSGVNAFVFYTGTIFEMTGSTLKSTYATIMVGVVQVLATFVSSQVVDRFGRRVLLLGSGLFMLLTGLVLAIFFSLKPNLDDDTVKSIGWVPITALIIFFISFSLGFGPIPWMASSELLPAEIKANVSSAAATFNWFLAFLVTKFYLTISDALGSDVPVYIFAAVCGGSLAFVFLLLPETKGKSLTQIQDELSGNTSRKNIEGFDNKAYQ